MSADTYCFHDILQDLIIETCFNFYKQHEITRLPCGHCGEHCKNYVNRNGLDVYGQKIDNHDANGELVECPVCKKSVSAVRFAPHPEKCLGMGRSSRPKRYSDESPPSSHQLSFRSNNKSSELEVHQEGGEKGDSDNHTDDEARPKRTNMKHIETNIL